MHDKVLMRHVFCSLEKFCNNASIRYLKATNPDNHAHLPVEHVSFKKSWNEWFPNFPLFFPDFTLFHSYRYAGLLVIALPTNYQLFSKNNQNPGWVDKSPLTLDICWCFKNFSDNIFFGTFAFSPSAERESHDFNCFQIKHHIFISRLQDSPSGWRFQRCTGLLSRPIIKSTIPAYNTWS